MTDAAPAIPCHRCPEFEAVVYPSTPDSAEEYDTFCNGHMDEDVFLLFMENRNEPEDTCPYLELLDRVAELEQELAEANEKHAIFLLAQVPAEVTEEDIAWALSVIEEKSRADGEETDGN